MVFVSDFFSALAMKFCVYPVASMAAITRRRVSSLTFFVPLMTCDTVDMDTLATLDTSAMVITGDRSMEQFFFMRTFPSFGETFSSFLTKNECLTSYDQQIHSLFRRYYGTICQKQPLT